MWVLEPEGSVARLAPRLSLPAKPRHCDRLGCIGAGGDFIPKRKLAIWIDEAAHGICAVGRARGTGQAVGGQRARSWGGVGTRKLLTASNDEGERDQEWAGHEAGEHDSAFPAHCGWLVLGCRSDARLPRPSRAARRARSRADEGKAPLSACAVIGWPRLCKQGGAVSDSPSALRLACSRVRQYLARRPRCCR